MTQQYYCVKNLQPFEKDKTYSLKVYNKYFTWESFYFNLKNFDEYFISKIKLRKEKINILKKKRYNK
jgi:hypothetical protein